MQTDKTPTIKSKGIRTTLFHLKKIIEKLLEKKHFEEKNESQKKKKKKKKLHTEYQYFLFHFMQILTLCDPWTKVYKHF